MKKPRARSDDSAFFLHSVDQFGRTIDPMVLTVAREIGPRALAYAELFIGDSALLMNLFEESAVAVSEALKRRPANAGPIHSLPSYLYRTFLRKMTLIRKREVRLENSMRTRAIAQFLDRQPLHPEISILFDEIMTSYGRVTRHIVFRRMQGFSSKEIATELGIETHAVEVRYSRALAQARELLDIRRRKS